MARQYQPIQRLRHRILLGSFVALGVASFLALPGAEASRFPDSAEAMLTDAIITSHNGFNMQIDDNGFSNSGGTLTDAHMYCVQATVLYRCGVGDNEILRVQGDLGDASLNETQGNQLAWMLSHRSGYTDIELQNAIWCISNPGEMPALAKGTELCNVALASAAPDSASLTLTTLGSGTATTGSAVHFSLATNAPSVNLAVTDGGPGVYLCGSAPDNGTATISGNQLLQIAPAEQRNFELCLLRDNIETSFTTTLHAALEATSANIQIWKHPSAPKNCQGLVDESLTTSRISVSSNATWDPLDGWITVQKRVVGDIADGTRFTIALSNANGVVATHSFPDADDAPWSHTFTGLTPGEYIITESATGGATHVTVTPGGPIVVSSDTGTVVEIVNEFVGRLRLTKRTDIPVDETFTFSIDCQYHQDGIGDWESPIRLAAGETFLSPELPAGTVCTVNESDAGSANSTMINADTLGVQTESVGTQSGNIVMSAGITADVIFTNNFSQTTSTTAHATSTSSGTGGSTTSVGATTSTDSGTVGSLGSTTSTSNTSTLVETGAESLGLAATAGATIVAGGAMVLVTHRRRRLRDLHS